jgi:DNA-binding MarR family transcriptional regulator
MNQRTTINRRAVGSQFSMSMKLIGKQIHTAFIESGENVTIEQYFLLLLLDAHENVTQQDISTLLNKDKSAILRQTDELESKRLVVRIPDTDDKRKKILMLTKKGVEVLARLTAIETTVFESFLKDVSDSDLEVISNVLTKIKASYAKQK